MECPGSLEPQENLVIWQKAEKHKDRKVVTNQVFQISNVGIFI
jgi:hypothetical protein